MKDCRDNMVFICDLEGLPGGQVTGKLSLTQIVHELDSDYDVRSLTMMIYIYIILLNLEGISKLHQP